MNLANKLANKAPERQHHWQALEAVARDGEGLLLGLFSKNCGFCLYSLFRRGITDRRPFLRRLSHRRSLFRWRLDGRFFRIVRRFSSWRLSDFLHGKSILTCSYAFSLDSKGSKSTFYFILLHSSVIYQICSDLRQVDLKYRSPASPVNWCVTPEGQKLTPKESSIRAYRNVCKVFLHSPCSNDRRRILARS